MLKKAFKNPKKSITNKIRSHSFAISFFICVSAFVYFILEINFGMQIHFDYSENGTTALTQLSIQSVPTVINGIIATTSVIIGLSGVIIGLLYRELKIKSERVGVAILSLSIAMIYSIFNEYNAFASLARGGTNFLEMSFKYSLSGFISSLFTLFIIFLIVAQVMSWLEKKELETV